jgi:hypothetical protein
MDGFSPFSARLVFEFLCTNIYFKIISEIINAQTQWFYHRSRTVNYSIQRDTAEG